MSFVFVGILVGLSLALTGSGGALLSIPLFITIEGFSLKLATFYALTVVMMASLISLISDYKEAKIKFALIISLSSLVSSYFFKDIKKDIPDPVISSLLMIVCAVSLYTLWRPNKVARPSDDVKINPLILPLTGLMVGTLNTLTGLGGGIILLPLFIKFFYFNESTAVATTLLSILISTSSSFYFQLSAGQVPPHLHDVLFMAVGVIGGILSVKWMVKKINSKYMFTVRRVVFSSIIFYTLISLLMKG